MIKNIFNAVKNFRATLFFGTSESCSKILNGEKFQCSVFSVYSLGGDPCNLG